MTDDLTIQEIINGFIANKERTTATETATGVIDWMAQDLAMPQTALREHRAVFAALWRGVMAYARDLMKHARIEALLNNGAEQVELFEEFTEFVCIGKEAEDWVYVRRRSLQQPEYGAALALLRSKHAELGRKIDRYQYDYDYATPYWATGLTFAEAYEIASGRVSRELP
jgi:hypothetical protein